MTTGNSNLAETHAQPRRAVAYVRVSTSDQNPSNQKPDLLRIARARGLEIITVYEEKASTAKRRPALEAMLLAAHRGRFDVLLLWALDRLGRSMVENLSTILTLDQLGVTVVSARENWLDTASPVRPLLIGIFSWVAEQERSRISERTRAGLARARSKGIRIGRPPKELDVQKLRSLRESGRSYREIARMVGAGASTVHRVLAADDVLQRAVRKPGMCRFDSKTPILLGADCCSFIEPIKNTEDKDDVDL
jgi:putative DNA-invertase from lambdoid prophage Rac